jgi:hypothetical protein
MTKLREYGIVTQAIRGQGYDGAANMAGKFSGFRTRIHIFLRPSRASNCSLSACCNMVLNLPALFEE